MTRREALELMSAALASAAAKPRAGWAGYAAAAMAVDDVRRLLPVDGRAPAPVRLALLQHPQEARLGCGFPPPPQAVALPTAAAKPGALGPKLAAIGGALITHTVSGALEAGGASPDWLALDAALLAARHPSPKPLPREDYAAFLRAIDFRCQIELHTLDPEEKDIHAWLEGTARWYRGAQAYIDGLAGALALGVRSPLFDARDPLFQLAERVRRAAPVTRGQFAAARPSSPYGRALAAALERLAKLS